MLKDVRERWVMFFWAKVWIAPFFWLFLLQNCKNHAQWGDLFEKKWCWANVFSGSTPWKFRLNLCHFHGQINTLGTFMRLWILCIMPSNIFVVPNNYPPGICPILQHLLSYNFPWEIQPFHPSNFCFTLGWSMKYVWESKGFFPPRLNAMAPPHKEIRP